jgi:ethanolamine utilization microcompartment shell protein EutS
MVGRNNAISSSNAHQVVNDQVASPHLLKQPEEEESENLANNSGAVAVGIIDAIPKD